MDTTFFLLLNVAALSGFGLVSSVTPKAYRSWSRASIHAVVVVLAIAAMWLRPGPTGDALAVVAGLAFLFLVALPSALLAYALRLERRGAAHHAARYRRYASFIHPTPDMRFTSAYAAALAHDDPQTAIAALQALSGWGTPAQQVTVGMEILRLQNRWSDMLALAARHPDYWASLALAELRAFGELGRVDDMVRRYDQIRGQLFVGHQSVAMTYVAAFAGRVDLLDGLRRPTTHLFEIENMAAWRAAALARDAGRRDGGNSDGNTGHGNTGKRDEGRAALTELATTATTAKARDFARRQLAEWDNIQPVALMPETVAVLDGIAQRMVRDAAGRQLSWALAPMTMALLAVISIAFGFELARGGAEDVWTLIDLGAVTRTLVIDDQQWWRLGAAMFLHFGWLHLASNMVLLALLGRLTEVVWGTWRMLMVYGLAGLGSSATVLALMGFRPSDDGIYLGASGAIYGLLGLHVARLIKNWWQSRDVMDRRQLRTVLPVLAIGFAVDLVVPQVSFAAHLSGFLIGVVLGASFAPTTGSIGL